MSEQTKTPYSEWAVDGRDIIASGSQGQRETIVKVCPTYGGLQEFETAKMILRAVVCHDQLVEALEASTEALEALMHQYSPDHCEDESVERYAKIIAFHGGTLAFIAKRFNANEAALSLAQQP